MNQRTIPSYWIVNLLILIAIQQSSSDPNGFYGTCNNPFTCRNIAGIRYPFRRHQDPVYCGYPGFELNCNEVNSPSINITNTTYRVLGIDPTAQILKIVREDMIESTCPGNLVNITIDHALFEFPSSYMNISFLFGCPILFNIPTIGSIFCGNNGVSPVFVLPGNQGPGSCETSVVVPVPVGFMNTTGLARVLQDGFEVRWNVDPVACSGCTQSSGKCVYDNATSRTTCACPEPPFLADTCTTTVNATRASSSPSSGPQPLS